MVQRHGGHVEDDVYSLLCPVAGHQNLPNTPSNKGGSSERGLLHSNISTLAAQIC